MGVEDQFRRGVLKTAIVRSVDTRNYSFDAQFIGSEGFTDSVPVGGAYCSVKGGGWMGAMPQVGDLVFLGRASDSQGYVPLAFLPYPDVTTVSGTADSKEISPRNRFRGDRPLLQEGDLGMIGPAGGHVLVKRGGLVEIVADEFCNSMWLADEKTVKTVCQNMILEGWFGSSEFFTVREEGRDTRDATPTGYSLKLKSIAQQAPHIFVDAGAVMEEENLPMPGYPTISKDAFGLGVCLRVMIFEQNFATNQAAAGLMPPDPRQARLMIRVSQSGNMSVLSKGQLFEEWRDKTTSVYGRDVNVAHSKAIETTEGGIELKSGAGVRIQARRGMEILATQDLLVRSRAMMLNGASMACEAKGAYKVNCGGMLELKAGGHGVLAVGGGLSMSCGDSLSQAVGGRFSAVISGADAVENTGRDVITHKTVVKQGKYAVRVETGSVEISMGPAGSAISSLKFYNDKVRQLAFVGRVELATKTGAKLILEPLGGFQLAGLNGSIHANAAGLVQIGPVGGVGGFVVTTTSHRDYVTGLPLMGSPNVVVTQQGPGIPTPAPVIPPPLPSIPLPDDVEFV